MPDIARRPTLPENLPADGLWFVTTANSTYELDMDRGTVRRSPGESAWPVLGTRVDESRELKLVALLRLEVGSPMVIGVDDGVSDDVWHTSVVTGIDRV